MHGKHARRQGHHLARVVHRRQNFRLLRKPDGRPQGVRRIEEAACSVASIQRMILVGEEITVDYKLKPEPEEQRIPCLCGAENCRLFLN